MSNWKLIGSIKSMKYAYSGIYNKGNIIIRLGNGIRCLSLNNGKELWSLDLSETIRISLYDIYEYDGMFLCMDYTDKGVQYIAFDKDGKISWSKEHDFTPAEDGYLGSFGGHFYFYGIQGIDNFFIAKIAKDNGSLTKHHKAKAIAADIPYFLSDEFYIAGSKGIFKLIEDDGVEQINDFNITRVLDYNEGFLLMCFDKNKVIDEIYGYEFLLGNKDHSEFHKVGHIKLERGLEYINSVSLHENKIIYSPGEMKGITCLDIENPNNTWNFGEEKLNTTSYTFIDNNIIVLFEKENFSPIILEIDIESGKLIKEIVGDFNIEEFYTFKMCLIKNSLVLSGPEEIKILMKEEES